MHQASVKRYAVAIHGGAGAFAKVKPEEYEQYMAGLKMALEKARDILARGGECLEAAVAAVVCLEDNPMFNCGKGAVFNHDGSHELDAAVMRGRDLACGAVAGVRTIKNPVLLAQAVMRCGPHVLLAGQGADEFAKTTGLETVVQDYYFVQSRYDQWQEACRAGAVELDHGNDPTSQEKMGTVGAVALDLQGNLAAATSTGGLTNKKYGRVGDSPLIGVGTYANNVSCAVSCTGKGEDFIRATVAHEIHALMVYKGLSIVEAANQVVSELPKGSGGLIAVDINGAIALPFNSHGMLRGSATSEGLFEVGLI